MDRLEQDDFCHNGRVRIRRAPLSCKAVEDVGVNLFPIVQAVPSRKFTECSNDSTISLLCRLLGASSNGGTAKMPAEILEPTFNREHVVWLRIQQSRVGESKVHGHLEIEIVDDRLRILEVARVESMATC